ncbi:hypothetical protein [Bacillus subtilis]|jgi:hypothetical protein|uniref:hypothetical protein n=1 Tax=Bacillus subtilis TaxID=1423 RepID=UPI002DB7D073|nr:hypothetical protein [Bacillus subtilis]MEC1275295.1 hypothetical protein [Bacillus subtilis]MEC1318391.1 hypothetical protein [Bacillus subtilis]MEC1495546.1 hypothetical protein [Bacillus subtilis]
MVTTIGKSKMWVGIIVVLSLLLVSFSPAVKADTKDKYYSTTSVQSSTKSYRKANTSGVYVKVLKAGRSRDVAISVFADANKGKGKPHWVNVSGRDGATLGKYVTAGHTYHLTNYAVERYGKNVPIQLYVSNGSGQKVEFYWSPDCR